MQPQTQGMGQDVSSSAPAPADAPANPHPMMQVLMNQDKAAPELSPTSAQVRTRATEHDAPSAAAQDTPQEQAKTVARRPPSWER